MRLTAPEYVTLRGLFCHPLPGKADTTRRPVDPTKDTTIPKVSINRINSGYRSSNAINNDFDIIEAGFENTLSRDGSGPNMMLAPLDMNSNPIQNLPAPTGPNDPVRYRDILTLPPGLRGFQVTTMEAIGATGDGTGDDSDAFEEAIRLNSFGWTVFGLGNYKISRKIICRAEANIYWESDAGPRFGKTIIYGNVTSTHDGIAFDVYGSRGGSVGVQLEFGSLTGPGWDKPNSIGFRLESGENRIKVGEIMGFNDGVLMNGCWSGQVEVGIIMNVVNGIRSQKGFRREFYPDGAIKYMFLDDPYNYEGSRVQVVDVDDFDGDGNTTEFKTSIEWGNDSESNDMVIIVDHIGGPFLNVNPFLAPRRARTAKFGLNLDHLTGCHFKLGDVQYVQRTADSVGIYFGPDTVGCTLHAYVEGSVPWNESGQLFIDEGRNNKFRLSASLSPDNVSRAITMTGIGGELSGLGTRTNPGTILARGPERGAGSVRVLPGAKWTDSSNVMVHHDQTVGPYNLNNQNLSIYTRSANCTYAALTTGLPDLFNTQAGARFTVSDNEIAFATSSAFTPGVSTKDRIVTMLLPVKLVSGPAVICPYIRSSVTGDLPLIPKGMLSQALNEVGEWQIMTLRVTLKPDITTFRLSITMRTLDDAQVGGCVIDVGFPIISLYENPTSPSFQTPRTPDVIAGRSLVQGIIPAEQSSPLLAGVVDCNYGPFIRITGTAAGLAALTNVSEGYTTLLNDTDADFNLLSTATINGVAQSTILVNKLIFRRTFVTIYKNGTQVYVQG